MIAHDFWLPHFTQASLGNREQASSLACHPLTMWSCCNTQPPISGTHCSLFSPPYGNTSTHNFPSTPAHTHTHIHTHTHLHLPSSSQLLFIDYWCIELNLTSDLCSLPTVVLLFLHAGLSAGDPEIFKESHNEKVRRWRREWKFGNRCMQIPCTVQACVTDKQCVPLQKMLQLSYFVLSQFYFCYIFSLQKQASIQHPCLIACVGRYNGFLHILKTLSFKTQP